jgi:trk system potassium uptake protein TrkH
VATGDNDILTSLSTALVTLGNIGPGFGKISPAGNYAFYPDYIKWYLSFIMMVGRLEVYTVIVLFTPKFWKR